MSLLLWCFFFCLLTSVNGRTWYEVMDEHLKWPENQKHCKLLVQEWDAKNPEEALRCIFGHTLVSTVPTLDTGNIRCEYLIAALKPEDWKYLNEEYKSEIVHCIIDRILTHALSDTFTSENFEGGVVWKRKEL